MRFKELAEELDMDREHVGGLPAIASMDTTQDDKGATAGQKYWS
jgi:hypothetical protein